jgi:predicted RNA-binding protein (virulence factor B family)
MRVYEHLSTDSTYKKDDEVSGIIYDVSDNFGAFVAVDNQFSALIPKKDAFGNLRVGQTVTARVAAVKADGKLDLSLKDKIPMQMDKDAQLILKRMEERGGVLPFTDKADPEIIKKEFNMSKNAFKRAVGRLLKEKKVEITEKTIAIREK